MSARYKTPAISTIAGVFIFNHNAFHALKYTQLHQVIMENMMEKIKALEVIQRPLLFWGLCLRMFAKL